MSDVLREFRSDYFKNDRANGIVEALTDNQICPPMYAMDLVLTVDEFLSDHGEDYKNWNATNIELLPSFNNFNFKFLRKGKTPYVVKIFSYTSVYSGGYASEVTSRKLLTSEGLFQDDSSVQPPKMVAKNDFWKTLITEFVPDLKDSKAEIIGNEKNQSDIKRRIVEFLVKLNKVQPTQENLALMPYESRHSFGSVFEIYSNALSRYEKFKSWVTSDRKNYQFIKWINKNNLIGYLDSSFDRVTDLVDPVVMHKKMVPEARRFNWGDVSFGALPYTVANGQNKLVPLDPEYSGWDHFSSGIISLLNHHQSENLPLDLKMDILQDFVDKSRLTRADISELDARLIVSKLHVVSRKLSAATKDTFDLPGTTKTHLDAIDWKRPQKWNRIKIDEFLEPALASLKSGFITIS